MTDLSSERNAGRLELDFERDAAVLGALDCAGGPGLFSVDGEGRFVGWSAGAEAITGYSRDEVCGKPCQLLEGPDREGLRELYRLVVGSEPGDEGLQGHECRAQAKDGLELELLVHARLLRDGNGAVYGALGSFVDLKPALVERGAEPDTLPRGPGGLVGGDPAMDEVFRRIRLAAASDVTTLITGESGTGKELAARAIHDLGDRCAQPFVAINCAAIPEALLESELFGHAKGAFTGAVRDRSGVFESANGGTLFLDEIGDVSPVLQLKLLRVLQERVVQRVGGDREVPVNVRVVTATNRDLQERIAEGHLREDFYYRIRVFDLRMPALRERRGDVPVLARHFVREMGRAQGKRIDGIAADALEALANHSWPGNVRELANAIEHALVVQEGRWLELDDLPEAIRRGRQGAASEQAVQWSAEEEAERAHILAALDAHNWNRTNTAKGLGVSRVTLWKRIRRYRIDEGVFRRGTRDELQ